MSAADNYRAGKSYDDLGSEYFAKSLFGEIAGGGGLTDTQLRATPVPVSGTVTANTGGLTDTQLRASAVPVSTGVVGVVGTFFQATQPVSATAMTDGTQKTQIVAGANAANVSAFGQISTSVDPSLHFIDT